MQTTPLPRYKFYDENNTANTVYWDRLAVASMVVNVTGVLTRTKTESWYLNKVPGRYAVMRIPRECKYFWANELYDVFTWLR